MSDTNGAAAAAAGTAAAAGAAAAAATQPWHQGIDAETIGLWNNKGWKADDPKALATELTKSYRELEKHFGTPADQLLKMPKADARPEDIKAFWGRLGAVEAKDYDLSSLKTAEGKDLPTAFVDTMKAALAAAFVPKDRAATIADAVVKYADSERSAKSATVTAKLAAEKAELAKNWGQNANLNNLAAMEAARRLGLPPDKVDLIAETLSTAGILGFDQAKDIFRRIGAGTTEDTFVERGATGGAIQGLGVTTREGAMSRLAELKTDPAWGKRLTTGDAQAFQEFQALTIMIDGAA